jgi:hypothetical protein
MNAKQIVLGVIFCLCISGVALADRTLSSTEVLQIFQTLTGQPKKTWIRTGTIEATHEEFKAAKTTDENEIRMEINKAIQEYQNDPNKRELTAELQTDMLAAIPFNVRYKLSNGYTMKSNVILKYDGNKFYWGINIDSRKDSIASPENLAGSSMTDQFNLAGNTQRVFCWDGEKYTIYSASGNQAVIDTTGSTPHTVNGPLTAGIIPWGYGYYTYKNLSATKCSAVEKTINGQTQISLTIQNSDGSGMVFSLDPQKNYAAISYLITSSGSIIARQYSNYQLVSGSWVPMTIKIEKYDASTGTLLASDVWQFNSISADVPIQSDFEIEYTTGAVVEFRSNITNRPAIYNYSNQVDTEQLLSERLEFAVVNSKSPQNCASAALKHIAAKLGKSVTYQQLAQLLNSQDKTTSLYAMKNFAQGLGLYCRAVKTDTQTLRNLRGYEVILHIPGKNHFTIMGDIDKEYIWSIDLASDKFFYRTDLSLFNMDWTEGIALVISNQPVTLEGNITEIADSGLQEIKGAAGYSCTRLLQEYGVIFCDYIDGLCSGLYEEYYTRYGCTTAASGSCTSSVLLRKVTSPCINDPYYPIDCTITGEWTIYYMRACS